MELSNEKWPGKPLAANNVPAALEFAGYTTILKEEPVYLNTNGWLHTGEESVD
jgi:hypothetical protein